jgi:hypothetical protein
MIFAFCIGHDAFDGNSGHHQFGKKYMERLKKAIVWDVEHAPGGTRYVEIDGELQPTSETSELYTIANNYTFARLASFFLDKHGFVNTIVAGAHCFGMIELDFRNTGCDFYAASDHKWQCGPGATGILYVRNHGDDLPKIWPQNSCLYRVSAQSVENDRSQIKNISGLFVLRSQENYPALQALLDACDLWEEIRGDHIETYICSLSRYLKNTNTTRFS